MRVYINVSFNHFRALQAWAKAREARVTLDVKTFQMEVRHRGRYYTLYPMFQARIDGRSVHTTELPFDATGFGGWRPYQPVKHSHSTEKLLFKRYVSEQGLPTPRAIEGPDAGAGAAFDYVLKADVGSFGKQIFGPFRAGTRPRIPELEQGASENAIFAEEFIFGMTCKIWFWGGRAFFAHAHSFATIEGNGVASVSALLERKLAASSLNWQSYADRDLVLDCLRYQGTDIESILPAGQTRWIDFRYSQHYEPSEGPTPRSDDALPLLLERTGPQIGAMGQALAALLKETFPVPILVSVDGMLSEDGTLHWLEMNSNSLMPPEGYAVMFDDLFP